jgi:signal transduction histidine kinase
MLIKEILKNSADHTNGKAEVSLNITKQNDKIKVYFSIQDDGPGLSFDETELTEIL